MRLLLAVTELAVGGAERVVLELARAAAERGDATAIAAVPGALDRELPEGVGRYPLPDLGRSPAALARTVVALARAVRSFDPDLIHAHNPKIAAVTAVARRFSKPRRPTPLVATHHGVPPTEARRAARAIRLADRVVCVSDALRAEVLASGADPGRAIVIPNGVSRPAPLDLTTRERLDAELALGAGPIVTAVGRLVPQKAHLRLLDAAAIVHDELQDARFLIVGDGPLRSQLEQAARGRGLGDVVTFTGVRPDARAIIARSDVLAFSSDWEGLPLAALEALAAGVPVVSTDVAGARDALGTGAGIVVPRDHAAIAGAIVELLRDPARRQRMAAEGRRLYEERFTTERMIESYLALYDSVREPAPDYSHAA
jgi:glycosyltransferase involved in cell wall biosynthesis